MATTGREDNIAKESTLAILPVCCFIFVFNLFVVSHMLAMAEGREDNIAEERMLAILPVCYFLFFLVVISLVSHMLAMAERQR